MVDKQVVQNYRQLYKEKHGVDFHGHDHDIQDIVMSVGVLASSQETDEAVVYEMEFVFHD